MSSSSESAKLFLSSESPTRITTLANEDFILRSIIEDPFSKNDFAASLSLTSDARASKSSITASRSGTTGPVVSWGNAFRGADLKLSNLLS